MGRRSVITVLARFLALATLAALVIAAGAMSRRTTQSAAKGRSLLTSAALIETPEQNAPEAAVAADEKKENTEVKGYALPPEKYRQAIEYSRAQYRLHFARVLYDLVVLLAVLGWRLAPRLRNLAERASSRRSVQVLVFAPLLLLVLGVSELPLEIYGHRLSLDYQQSVETWGSWSWDWGKGQMIDIVAGVFLVWVLYGTIRRSAGRWWFHFWLASIPITVFVVFVAPMLVDPLFYKFEPLADTEPALVNEIGKVVERAGMRIPPGRMFEMQASEQLKSGNAYVTGIGNSNR